MGKLQISALIFILPAFIGLKAQIFSPAQKISNADNPQVVRSADFNSDGYADVVYSSIADHKIAVAFYDAVSGSFGAEQVLSTAFTYAVSLFAADLNGDSFVDVLTVSQISNTVAWFKNDGSGGFILQPLISSNAGGAIGVIAEDIDGDDDNDVIVAAKDDNTIGWYENTDGNGSFSPAHIITDEGEFPVVILSADPDNDGDQDIVAGMLAGNSIVWYPNDGNGNFGVESPITTEVNFISAIYAADLNGDGNIDIVSASRSDNKIAWYENLGGNGVFSSQHIVSEYVTMAYDVVAADFDLDNDQDLVCSAMGSNQILVFNNQDGAGNFLPAQMISEVCEVPKGLTVADFDNDGDEDIAAALSQQDPDVVTWYENGEATFVVHTIRKNRCVWRIAVHDINNDGNRDLFYSDGQVVCWIENHGSAQSFGEETILFQGYNVYEIAFNDIDNDGDQDFFIADAMGDKVVWLENTDGNGTFSTAIVIDDTGDGPADIDFSDVDGDSDNDFLVFFVNEPAVVLYINTDGQGTFAKNILASVDQYSGCFIDIDHDNDDDIAFSAYEVIQYFENDGTGNFAPPQTIAGFGYSWKILPAQMNNDDFPDLVYSPDYMLHWLENNQNGTFEDHQVEMWGSVNDFTICNPDNDGDPDVLSACRGVGLVNFTENMNNGDTLITVIPFLVDDANAVMHGDLNNDGREDIVVGSWPAEGLYWAENYQYRILVHPSDQYACEGDKSSFSVVSTGVKVYQWQVNTGTGFFDLEDNDVYTGTDKALLSIVSVTPDLFGNEYRCRVFDKTGAEIITDTAVLYQDCTGNLRNSGKKPLIRLYPNPSSGIVNLTDYDGVTNIVIRNIFGEIIVSDISVNKNHLDVSGFESGIYIVTIHTEKGYSTHKFIKY